MSPADTTQSIRSLPKAEETATGLRNALRIGSAFTLLFICSIARAFVPATGPGLATASILPGLVSVSTSQSFSVTITMVSNGVSTSTRAVTQGIAGADFAVQAGGTCAAGVSYTAGQQCTVNVLFQPKYPGTRTGAMQVLGSNGIVLGSTLVSASAVGSLPVLVPGRIDDVAGNGFWTYNGDGENSLSAQLFLPMGVATDAAGNIYISDSQNNRLRRVDAQTHFISTIAGTGITGYSGDGGQANQAMISNPSGIVLDGEGNIYFADAGNSIIRRIDAVTGVITTIAGTPGVTGWKGDGQLATLAQLSTPEGIAFSAMGDLLIADTGNNVIRDVDAGSGIITTIIGTGVAGFSGDGQAASAAELESPWGVGVGSDGLVYIADLKNNRVRMVNATGIISTIAGNGVAGFTGDGHNASTSELNAPTAVVLDAAGDIFIADSGNNSIRRISAYNNEILSIIGTDGEGQYAGDGTPSSGSQSSLYGPYALSLDGAGNLFIADMFDNRIRRISSSQLYLGYAVIKEGGTSAPYPLGMGLVNEGNAPLTLSQPILVNASFDPASTTCNSGTALVPANLCLYGADFQPQITGNPVVGSITFNSDSTQSAPVVTLTGEVLSVNPTTTTLVSSENPSILNGAVTFTASVSSANTALTGTVAILDGSNQLCSVALSANNSIVCTTSTLSLGQHSITANYSGDSGDAASTSTGLSQIVQQASVVVLSANPNPAIVTNAVSLNASVTSPNGSPTGSVVFYDGTNAIGSGALSVTGIASFSTSQLAIGTHNLSAQYAGDATDAPAQSAVVNEVVQQGPTVTMLASNSATANVGSNVIFTASVVGTAGLTPSGTVKFTDGTSGLGSVMLDNTETASLSISTLLPGIHAILATYSGDTDDTTSSSSPLAQVIQQIGTTTTLSSSANPSNAGAPIQLTAIVTVTPGASTDGAITGQVTFNSGSTNLGTSSVDANGIAVLSLSTLQVGQTPVVAVYSGNPNYASSTSVVLNERVTKTSSTTVLATSAQNSFGGQTVTLTATITSSEGVPTGTISFIDGSTTLGQASANGKGVATLSASTLGIGSHTLTAVYSGDVNYEASTSTSALETVSMAATSLTLSAPTGQPLPEVAVDIVGTLSSNGTTPTGTIFLNDSGRVIAQQAASASFHFSSELFAVGSHALTATYSGDSNNSQSTSVPLVLVVTAASTSTSLSSSATPQFVGKNVTLTATATSSSPNVSGLITFQDSGTVLGSVGVNSQGTATLTTSTLSFGTHSISAIYGGDTNHAGSTSVVVAQQIVQTATSNLSSSLNPSPAGAVVVFSTTVTGIGGIVPTGSVTFADNSNTVGTVSLDATGTATFQTTSLAVGSHTFSANYNGDKNYGATVASLIQTVQNASTQISLTTNSNPADYRTPVAISAVVTSNGGVASGSVSFVDSGTSIGTAILNTNGVATLAISTLAPGNHSIVANYAGDGRALPSSSTPLPLVVKELTTVNLVSATNPAQTLTPIALTVSVTNAGVGVPSGTITITDGTNPLGTVTLDNTGTASMTMPSLSAGNHSLVASYAGDGNNFTSTSQALVEAIALRSTSTVLSATQTNTNNPQQVTLIAAEHWTGATTPTGTVTFMNDSNVIGTSPVDSSGLATITIYLQSESEIVTAIYGGDNAYSGSSSADDVVKSGPATQYSLQLNPSTVSVQHDQHTTTSLTLTSVQGFTDKIRLGCDGLPFAATCTFSNDLPSLAAGSTSTVQLTIDTGDPLGSGEQANYRAGSHSETMMCLLSLGAFLGLPCLRSRRRPALVYLLAACAFVTALGASGCSGLTTNGTPPGSYTFNVTAVGQGTGATTVQLMTLTVVQ